jgi:riboflavin biosynthesis pyrimidine reductase
VYTLNPPLNRRPFITLSFAQTLDGSIAPAEAGRLNISSESSLALTHRLRSMHDCILVGAGTVRVDNPRLNVRWGSSSVSGKGRRVVCLLRRCRRAVLRCSAQAIHLFRSLDPGTRS